MVARLTPDQKVACSIHVRTVNDSLVVCYIQELHCIIVMADLLSGGAVGAVTGEVLKYALQTIQNGLEFGPTLEMNIETLNALAPLVEQIKDYSDLLGRPRE
ncbi:putative LRR receptor-like protein kinase [Trifolium pratense]|uniref:Putative LRR receptor-like protein kinase n=1 Tax=Trifolium pratense TaxID=57577 RepID=A0A2K3PL14_TRIPR|nr:putative LRR receptor-like protein kinase [Trifolium pratense]